MHKYVKGMCQRCGFIYPRIELRRDGYKRNLWVCADCYDIKHPQELVRGVPDHQAVRHPSPEPADVFLSVGEVTPEDL